MKRLGETIAIATASAVLIGGDTVQPSLEQMAPDARIAIAGRYESCDIVSVELDQTTLQGIDELRRNELKVGVAIQKTADALHYEKVFAEDDTVIWEEPVAAEAFIDVGAENATTSFGLGKNVMELGDLGAGLDGNAPAGVLSWAPRSDYEDGTRMDIYLANYTRTYGDHASDEALGFSYCGTLEAASDNETVTDWLPVGRIPGLSSFVLTRECEMVTSNGVSFTRECPPDWQRVN